MGYTYAQFSTALATELAVSESNADFVALLPTFIDDSEQRCYRELDLLTAQVILTGAATANNRAYTLPTGSGHVLGVSAVNVLDGSSVRHPVVPTTREVIDFLWPSNTAASASTIPVWFARINDTQILFGPPPGATWTVESIATVRPTALSVSNTTTYLSQYLSDLFFAGAMISASGFMRNFGSQSDDPRMAVSWEQQFQTRLASAKTEEMRKKFISMTSIAPGRAQ